MRKSVVEGIREFVRRNPELPLEDHRTLLAEIDRLRYSLEFYARIGVPEGTTPTVDVTLARDPYWQDQGKIARKALGWGK